MEIQIRNHIRLTLVKLREYNTIGEAYEAALRKILVSSESVDIIVSKIIGLEIKNDYQYLIIMTFVSELITIMQGVPATSHNGLPQKIESVLMKQVGHLMAHETVNKQVQSFHYLKKMEILRLLLSSYQLSTSEDPLQHYKTLYRHLKDCQNVTSNTNKEHFKITFVSIHRHIIDDCRNEMLIESVISEVFEDSLKAIDQANKTGFEWMRTIDTRFLILQYLVARRKLQPLVIYKLVFLLIKASALKNIYVHVLSLGIAQSLLHLLTQIKSPLLYIILTHIITNPLAEQLQSPDDLMFAELLLAQVVLIFRNQKLLFSILRSTDLNIHSKGIVYDMVTRLYDYVDAEEKKQQRSILYESVKKGVKAIMESVKEVLEKRTDKVVPSEIEQKIKFYRLKEREYQHMVANFNNNEKPIKQVNNANEYQLDQYYKFVKKSPHINPQKMIEIFGLDTPVSKLLLDKYVESFKLDGYPIEQAFRIFLSNFFLIGESQQISRVINKITYHMAQHQKDKTKDWDAVFLICSSILMLNTDLHNPMNQTKMLQSSWLKICNKLPQSQSLSIYSNISHNKIQCFRDYSNLHNINLPCFLHNFYADAKFWSLSYIDPELREFQQNPDIYKYMSYEILETVLVGKEVDKMIKLVEQFVWREDVYECEILEILRVLVQRGKVETPARMFAVASGKVGFAGDAVDERYVGYYWLCCKIVLEYYRYIPYTVVCDFLMATCKIRKYLQDDLYTRTQMKVKRIKQAVKQHKAKLLKKNGSIYDILNNFFADRQSSDDQFKPIQRANSFSKRAIIFKRLALQIHDQIVSDNVNRLKCVAHFTDYLHDPQNKIPVENFIVILFMVYDIVYLSADRKCLNFAEELFEEVLDQRESSLANRLKDLKKKKQKKHELLVNLTQYYIIKIMLEYIEQSPKYQHLTSISIIEKANANLLCEFVSILKNKARDSHSHLYRIVQAAIVRNCQENKISEVEINEFIERRKVEEQCRGIVGEMLEKVVVGERKEEENREIKAEINGKKEKQIEAVENGKENELVSESHSPIKEGQEEIRPKITPKEPVQIDQPTPHAQKSSQIQIQSQNPNPIPQNEIQDKPAESHKINPQIAPEVPKEQIQPPVLVQPINSGQHTQILQNPSPTPNPQQPQQQDLPPLIPKIQLNPQPQPTQPPRPLSPRPPPDLNYFSDKVSSQQQILQAERQYFKRLLGENEEMEENFHKLELPIYML